ncbi:hypothetical protein J437_LFUL014807 [Ladona fulva]|uniref:DDE Tnp4 domain-containing protein n=1 Tax=Ladona fulva TaxID=123851 RepID=A0A8K0KFL4_LADFU|nr:hypothetical protein J437_LFUL014807 [Ladona fulva]
MIPRVQRERCSFDKTANNNRGTTKGAASLLSLISYILRADSNKTTPHTEDDWRKTAKDFEVYWNYLHCIGACDGKHIMIQNPINSGRTFDTDTRDGNIIPGSWRPVIQSDTGMKDVQGRARRSTLEAKEVKEEFMRTLHQMKDIYHGKIFTDMNGMFVSPLACQYNTTHQVGDKSDMSVPYFKT